MLGQFLLNFTWLDGVILVIIIRCVWMGFQKGAVAELFKVLGVLAALVVSLHFYLPFGNALRKILPIVGIFGYLIPLVGLTVLVLSFFQIVREGTIVLFQKEEIQGISRFLGMVVGAGRALLLGSFLLMGCLILENPRLDQTVRKTFANQWIGLTAPVIYSTVYDAAIHPVFPQEEKNTAVMALAEGKGKSGD